MDLRNQARAHVSPVSEKRLCSNVNPNPHAQLKSSKEDKSTSGVNVGDRGANRPLAS